MKRTVFLGLFLLWTAGCATLEPVVSDFNILSVPEEVQLGNQMAQEIARQMPVIETGEYALRVRTIGERLITSAERPFFDYQFFVVDNNTPNAFTIPGGKIYVHTGLLRFVDDESQLAGVLAHEIGHAQERHPTKALSRAYGLEYLSQMIFKGNSAQGEMQRMALGLAKGGLLTRYTRNDEREADEMGYYLLRRAGYPTHGLLTFLRKMLTLERGRTPVPFLSTHPPTPERIARLEQLERQVTVAAAPAR